MSQRRVLSYHDVLLREADVQLLQGPYWLNDQIIEFYFEYLRHERYNNNDSILLLPGAITYLLAHNDAQVNASIMEPHKMQDRSIIMCAVNDNEDPHVALGGSHWSLLVWVAADRTFRHYDSASGHNGAAARKVAAGLWALLQDHDEAPRYRLVEPPCPQQMNGSDCGLYVLAIAQFVGDIAVEGPLVGSDDRLVAELGGGHVERTWRQVVLSRIHQLITSEGSS